MRYDPPAMTDTARLDAPLPLPCGATLKNRFMKSAMSEQLGDARNDATHGLATLYGTWADGGTGLLVTGNVMIDRTALGEPLNVAIDGRSNTDALARWAEAARRNDTHVWMQLNHPGKQSPSVLSREPVAPSAVAIEGPLGRFFNKPQALSDADVHALVERFAEGAAIAQRAGFTGVQIHGAHGYLVNQFLSPHHNRRDDAWGGDAERRRAFVVAVYRAIRARVGKSFPVSIKLNSADFQRGGFTEEESMAVIDALVAEGIDLVEVSGGTYEAPAMTGFAADSTRKREAYFLDFAERARQRVKGGAALAVTGGFRSGPAMRDAVASGATDVVGLARTLALYPDLPARVLRDPSWSVTLTRPSTGIKAVDRASMLDISYYETQLERMAQGLPADPSLSAWRAVYSVFSRMGLAALQPRRA